MDKSDLTVRGAAAALASKDEVKRLILAAQEAHREQKRLGLTDDTFDVWRHAALWDAVRKTSFRSVGQKEFGQALSHFLRLAGKDGPQGAASGWQRTNAHIAGRESGPEGDRRRAEYMLRKTCGEVKAAFEGDEGQALAYACVLLRTIHATTLDQAQAKQIVQTMFTMRTRAKARLAKARKQEATR